MSKALARARQTDSLTVARTIIVSSCAIALIVAERFLPFA